MQIFLVKRIKSTDVKYIEQYILIEAKKNIPAKKQGFLNMLFKIYVSTHIFQSLRHILKATANRDIACLGPALITSVLLIFLVITFTVRTRCYIFVKFWSPDRPKARHQK